jgi:CubicO group peptidase (beta-lactamase class C family)
MRNQILFLIILAVHSVSCVNGNKAQNEIIDNNKRSEIDNLLNRYLDLGRFSGVVLVSNAHSVLYHGSFGYANYEAQKSFSKGTAFKIGEITELVTRELIDGMVRKGDFRISDKVSNYLPEIKADFTIKDLLTHNTHLPNIEGIQKQSPNLKYSTLEFVNLVENNLNNTGKSDLNYNILGVLIEKISKKSFQENVDDWAKKRSLDNTYFVRTDSTEEAKGYLFGNFSGNGLELQESPTYKLAVAFSSRGLKSSALDLSKIVHSKPKRDVNIHGYLSNDGFSYSLTYQADKELAIIVLSNRRHPVAKEISNAINSVLKGEAYKIPLRRDPVDINPKLFNEYVGKYQLNDYVKFEVVKEADSLFILMGHNKVTLLPQSNNQFFMIDNDAAMRFERDSTNKVTSVVLLNGFIESNERARKIETNE